MWGADGTYAHFGRYQLNYCTSRKRSHKIPIRQKERDRETEPGRETEPERQTETERGTERERERERE